MDKIKGFIDDLKGDDGKLGLDDITGQVGNIGLGDLKDLSWPVEKAELVSMLEQRGTNEQIISAVERVPQDRFDSLADLKSKIGL